MLKYVHEELVVFHRSSTIDRNRFLHPSAEYCRGHSLQAMNRLFVILSLVLPVVLAIVLDIGNARRNFGAFVSGERVCGLKLWQWMIVSALAAFLVESILR